MTPRFRKSSIFGESQPRQTLALYFFVGSRNLISAQCIYKVYDGISLTKETHDDLVPPDKGQIPTINP